jgi:primary-amine oxidase
MWRRATKVALASSRRFSTLLSHESSNRFALNANLFHNTTPFATTPRLLSTNACAIVHPLDPLSADEISCASAAVKKYLSTVKDTDASPVRFVAVSLNEPKKKELLSYYDDATSPSNPMKRMAEVVALVDGICSELLVDLSSQDDEGVVVDHIDLPAGTQPLFSPDDCDLAEAIAKSSPAVQKAVLERYGIKDVEKELVCDPWSVHLADEADTSLTTDPDTGRPRRLIQTFLYQRMLNIDTLEDNHYAHPIDIVPVVDLNTGQVIRIDGMDRPPPKVPALSVNYHRNLLSTNSYLENKWRGDRLKELNVVQPDGPSFDVEGNFVAWQGWTFRVGFNYREGLVLHNLKYHGRDIVHRASLVEMAVPYGDPHPPYQRKCAFDVGDYGLGYCANSLELGCDCLGHIYYFDSVMSNSKGEPVEKKKVVCMHEEDDGLLWKHVEYRNGHNESRRGRELIISSIATVVNYEYLFYWRLKQDGTIDFEIKLSGELSTNLLSPDEEANGGVPTHWVIVAPGVNAQVHQHMFCARLDMAVDGHKNVVSEVDVVSQPDVTHYGNAFGAKETVLKTEQEAIRLYDATKSRGWKISNAEGKTNPVNGKATAYKLMPFTKGSAGPTVLTAPSSTVTTKGKFATANLWVTPHDDKERYPAGEYTPQGDGSIGLSQWTASNRSLDSADVVLWHAFGVTHVPRVEDFPVMPCETTGFMLKPDGFFAGNPAIDIPPSKNDASKLASEESCCS